MRKLYIVMLLFFIIFSLIWTNCGVDPPTRDNSSDPGSSSYITPSVTSPKEGDRLTAGSNITINWSTTAILVDISYSKNGAGGTYDTIATSLNGSSGSYNNWSVPIQKDTLNNCYIKINDTNYPDKFGISTSFSIIPASVSSEEIELSPTSLDFDSVTVDDISTMEFSIENNSTSAYLNVTGITPPAGFTVDESIFTIEPGKNKEVTVTFAPIDEKLYSGDIRITSGVGERKVTVSGIGRSQIELSPTSLDFDSVTVDDISIKTFTIYNKSNKNILEVTGITPPAGFTVDESIFTIEPGKNKEVTVTFAPIDEKLYSGDITITSGAPSDETVSVEVEGIGSPEE
ncbi:choice-of-anchor D domain-containing protein [candidate division KSB1 bacterium]